MSQSPDRGVIAANHYRMAMDGIFERESGLIESDMTINLAP